MVSVSMRKNKCGRWDVPLFSRSIINTCKKVQTQNLFCILISKGKYSFSNGEMDELILARPSVVFSSESLKIKLKAENGFSSWNAMFARINPRQQQKDCFPTEELQTWELRNRQIQHHASICSQCLDYAGSLHRGQTLFNLKCRSSKRLCKQ